MLISEDPPCPAHSKHTKLQFNQTPTGLVSKPAVFVSRWPIYVYGGGVVEFPKL